MKLLCSFGTARCRSFAGTVRGIDAVASTL